MLQQLEDVDPNIVTEYIATSIAHQVSEFQKTLSYIQNVIKKHITDDMIKEHKEKIGGGTQDVEDNIPDWILAIACAAEPRVNFTMPYLLTIS